MFGFRKEATIVSCIPKKLKNVTLTSSLHFDDTIDHETGDQLKQEIVTFYNGIKCGVDIVDQMCSTYNVAQYSRRWPMVIFYTMLNISEINTQVIYMGNKNEVNSRRLFLKRLCGISVCGTSMEKSSTSKPSPSADTSENSAFSERRR